MIGQEWVEDISNSRQISGNMSMGENRSFKLEYPFRPEDFTQLMTGGPSNNFDVQAIVHRQGTPWDNQQKRNFKKLIFNQNHHL